MVLRRRSPAREVRRMHAPDKALDCWPDRRQRLLLRAALLADGDALDAWQAWKSEADFDQLDYGTARILPLLYRNLTFLQIHDPFLRRLKGIYRRTWYANQLTLRDLAGL